MGFFLEKTKRMLKSWKATSYNMCRLKNIHVVRLEDRTPMLYCCYLFKEILLSIVFQSYEDCPHIHDTVTCIIHTFSYFQSVVLI